MRVRLLICLWLKNSTTFLFRHVLLLNLWPVIKASFLRMDMTCQNIWIVTLVFQFWLSFDILVGFFSFFFCKSWDISFFLTWKIISLLPDAREVNIIRISLWPVHYGIFLSCNLRRKNILVGENSQEYPGILTTHTEFVLWVYSFLFPPKPTSALQIDLIFGVNVLHYYKTWTPIQRNCWNFTFTSLQNWNFRSIL